MAFDTAGEKTGRVKLPISLFSAVIEFMIGYVTCILRKRLTDNDTRFERKFTRVYYAFMRRHMRDQHWRRSD